MKLFIIAIFILNSLFAYTQNKAIDSLQKILQTQKEDTIRVNYLTELASEFWDFNNDTSFYLANQALTLAKKLQFRRGIARAYNFLGITWFNKGEYAESLKSLYAAVKQYEGLGQKKSVANSLQLISGAYYYQRDNLQALENNSNALKIMESLKDTPGMAQSHRNAADIYLQMNKPSEALNEYYISLKLYNEVGNRFSTAYSTASIGKVYESKGDSLLERQDTIASRKEFDNALKNYKDFMEVVEHDNVLGFMSMVYTDIARVNVKRNNLSEARLYLNKGHRIARQLNNKLAYQQYYDVMTKVNLASGEFRYAYENYKMYISYRDSLINEESTKKSVQVKMQYEFDKKQDSTKAAQEKKDAIALAEITNQRLVRNFSLAGVVAVVSLGGISFYRYRRRRKLQSEQEMLNERLRISRELHDDMGSTLGSISIYSEVAKNRSQKNENAEEAILKIGIASRELIEKMSDIVWSINPNNESFEQLQNRMQAFAAMILTPRDVHYDFIVDEEIHKLKLTAVQRKNIFLIFKEAVYNIVKYAECSKVEIKLSLHNDRFGMQIKDDGKGFDVASQNAETINGTLGGNGLKNMKARAKDIDAVINIHAEINVGTTVHFCLNC